jgi:hexosaminidase
MLFLGSKFASSCRRLAVVSAGVLCLAASGLCERSSDRIADFNLRPQPKEVTLHEGGFRLTQGTKILVLFGHQEEDRIAAETLAEEIADQSGLQLNIEGVKASSKAEDGAIVLARLQDRRVRRFLSDKGLSADDSVGENGYLLFSDKSHLIVAANSGEGLFYGVQTLRQLLRPAGKHFVFPSVTIRDWPTSGDGRDDVTRTTPPQLFPPRN